MNTKGLLKTSTTKLLLVTLILFSFVLVSSSLTVSGSSATVCKYSAVGQTCADVGAHCGSSNDPACCSNLGCIYNTCLPRFNNVNTFYSCSSSDSCNGPCGNEVVDCKDGQCCGRNAYPCGGDRSDPTCCPGFHCDQTEHYCEGDHTEYCGDGTVNNNEQCEKPDTNNNNYCDQSISECSGKKLGTRDAFGNCDAACGCTEDAFSYVCVLGQCGATCDDNTDCAPKCEGNVYNYGGTCDTASTCACSYSSENCDLKDGWYDTGNTRTISNTVCSNKEQKEQEYREYSCATSGCTYTTTQTKWIDTETTYLPSTTVCRVSAGVCDNAEYCTGSSANCPSDVFKPITTTCRASAGVCDVEEKCTGTAANCPTDTKLPSTTTCRASAGICDNAELCTGTTNDCPTDVFKPSTTTCRASAGVCDVAETCTGTAANCPTDVKLPSTTTCRASNGVCDNAELCTGTTNDCPTDIFKPSNYECRASAGICDVAETCTGTAANCPTDIKKPSTYECRASAGICDLNEYCTGTANDCPTNLFKPSTTICRAATGQCDQEEKCTGTSAPCPTDVNKTDGTICNDGLFCSTPDVCTNGVCGGLAKDCSDTLFCTINEHCDETSDSCVSSPKDCSANNITQIATCDNNPDSIHYTYDYRNWFTSVCNEASDICTGGNNSISHTCDPVRCDAECDDNSDCAPKCVGNTRYFTGSCLGSCTCSYSTENCDSQDGWYNTTNTQWISTGDCTEKEQKQQMYRDYSCAPSGCNYTETSNRWIDTGNNRNKANGTTCNDGLFCTTPDVCTSGVCGGLAKDCSDNLFCTINEHCDETSDSCVSSPKDCSANNITQIATCDNNPDSIHYTYDFRNWFTSVCNEASDICTSGNNSISHTCDPVRCDAECDDNSDCAPKCVGNMRYYTGSCLGSCTCSYSTENCDSQDGWYNTTNTQWISTGDCTEKEQKQQMYRDYSCAPSGCNYTETSNRWIDTGNNRNKANGTTCNDGLFCTTPDVCTNGVCGGTAKDCSDSLFCTVNERCDEANDRCTYDNKDCSVSNITGISTCDNIPDSVHFTFDFRTAFASVCDETSDVCTSGNSNITHTCNVTSCGAQCDATHSCTNSSCSQTYNDYCVGTKLVEYDSDKIKDNMTVSDTCANSCFGNCTCTNCTTSCSPPQTNNYCVMGICGATCDDNTDCDDGNTHTADSCNMSSCGCTHTPINYCGDGIIQTGDGEECEAIGTYAGWGVSGYQYTCEDDNTYSECVNCQYEHVNECMYYCSGDIECNGTAPGSYLESCNYGFHYLQDFCNADCELQDNNCEDDYTGCTAEPECDELIPGTGDCNYMCEYKPLPVCGNSIVEFGEKCELPNSTNNSYCTQNTTTACLGQKKGSRDAFGNCSSSCGCTYDQFDYQCVLGQCGATCDDNTDCAPKCEGSTYYSGGTCNTTSTCACSYSSENCDLSDGWYNTTNTQWISTGDCTEKEQLQQEYREYSCAISGCTYSVTNNQWIDTGSVRNKANGTTCNDGLFCTTPDVCTSGVCGGLTKDCSANNLPTIQTCNNIPDNKYFTWDYAAGFISICDETNDRCTNSSYNYTHTCDPVRCDAECDDNSDCANKCIGNIRSFGGTCNTTNSCACNYNTENCDDYDNWYNTTNIQWVDTSQCTEKEQKQQMYRDYSCAPSGCNYTETDNRWIDTGSVRNKANGTVCNDGLFCTTPDVCTNGVCGGITMDCSDGVFCTKDSCDEINDRCNYVTNDSVCNDGQWCNGAEYCDLTFGCMDGQSPVCTDNLFCTVNEQCDETNDRCAYDNKDCSVSNITGISTCDNIPDSVHFTFDFRTAFASVCDETSDICTSGNSNITHTCNVTSCGAQCDSTHNCQANSCNVIYSDYCENNRLVEYDNDYFKDNTTVTDSCSNNCLGSCTCTNCTTDCSPPQTNNYCVMGICGATCDSNNDCDDGNVHTIDACISNCSCKHDYVPFCGDGNKDAGEECDANGNNGIACVPDYNGSCTYCSNNCTNITLTDGRCGDQIVQTPYEDCDGNSRNCTTQTGYFGIEQCSATCAWNNCQSNETCGDGVVNGLEQCDADGSNGIVCIPGYGSNCTYCLTNCTPETLTGPYCGDGILNAANEECDDNNSVGGDGCSASCDIETPVCTDTYDWIDYARLDSWCGGDMRDVTYIVNYSDDIYANQGACSNSTPNYIYLNWYDVNLTNVSEVTAVLEHKEHMVSVWVDYYNGTNWVAACDIAEYENDTVSNCVLSLTPGLTDIKLRIGILRTTVCHEAVDQAYIALKRCAYPGSTGSDGSGAQDFSADKIIKKSSRGGGGGGSGGALLSSSTSSWECGEWSECLNSEQTRECKQGTLVKSETQSCSAANGDSGAGSGTSSGSTGSVALGIVGSSMVVGSGSGLQMLAASTTAGTNGIINLLSQGSAQGAELSALDTLLLSSSELSGTTGMFAGVADAAVATFAINWQIVMAGLLLLFCLPLLFQLVGKK